MCAGADILKQRGASDNIAALFERARTRTEQGGVFQRAGPPQRGQGASSFVPFGLPELGLTSPVRQQDQYQHSPQFSAPQQQQQREWVPPAHTDQAAYNTQVKLALAHCAGERLVGAG